MASLERFYLEKEGIFARSVVWDGKTWTQTEPSLRNTANILIAVYQLRRHGFAQPLDADALINRSVAKYLGQFSSCFKYHRAEE